MAIAPLEERGDQAGAPRRPRLRMIEGGRTASAAPRRAALHARPELDVELRRSRALHPSSRVAPPRRDLPTSAPAARPGTTNRLAATMPKGRPSPSAATRRRRAGGVAVVLVALVLLAMPLRALGAVTVLGQPTPGGVPAGLAPGARYVVQPGDTLRSIAERVNPAAAGAIAAELARSTGSARVVPGEHLLIPFG